MTTDQQLNDLSNEGVPCKRGPSGSLWPCSHKHRIGEPKCCRDCGQPIRLTKVRGIWDHKSEARS